MTLQHDRIAELCEHMKCARLGFVQRAENVALLGPSGVGKSQVSIALMG